MTQWSRWLQRLVRLRASFTAVWGVARAFQVTRIKVECCRDERFVKARRVNAKNFFTDLRRRHVYKIAVIYAVVAWLLIQVATQVFPFLQIPNGAVRLLVETAKIQVIK
jgi:hypothetical protein